jgi:hypothetical protein
LVGKVGLSNLARRRFDRGLVVLAHEYFHGVLVAVILIVVRYVRLTALD